jgi:peptidoglycan/LPS O-acetylase OafA/YrhL
MSVVSTPSVTTIASTPVSSALTGRLPLLDLLRAVAAHLVVWHHLAFYGPLSDGAYLLVPGVIEWLNDWGRIAVQVFFVVGGFVAAVGFWKQGQIDLPVATWLVGRRYRRIAGPYLVALLVAMGANAVAAGWMNHHSVSAPPMLPQVLAHIVLLQDVLGYEALTAGIWYLAIDFQLYLLTLAAVFIARRAARSIATVEQVFYTLIGPLAVASLFWFNRDSRWDEWAVYFLGSYTLGIVVEGVASNRLPRSAFWVSGGLMVVALIEDWRPRLAVSLASGTVIYAAVVGGWLTTWPKSRWVELFGQTSYSLFLIHFPVCLMVNAWLSQLVLASPAACLAGMIAAYVLSVLASLAFHYGVERAFR